MGLSKAPIVAAETSRLDLRTGQAADELSRALENSNTVRLSLSDAGPLEAIYVVTSD